MRRGARIAIVLLVILAALLAVNTIVLDDETRNAEVTVEGGELAEVGSSVELQYVDRPATGAGEEGQPPEGRPIVLLHCYTCSTAWWDELVPLLNERHRVITVDLIGHGGSEKPSSGYEITAQSAAVAELLNGLGVRGATVAGHSMGGFVATSLAEQASQLVDRAVVIDMAPNTRDFGDGLPFTAKLGYVPVVGPAFWRVTPDFVLRDELNVAFAPGFDTDSGFDQPDTPLEDLKAMTYTAYADAHTESDDYVEEAPLDQRFTAAAVPLMVIFGAEDQIFDAERAVEGFAGVPGVRTEIIDGAGHAPQVEKPEEVARLLESFAVDVAVPAPSASDRRPSPRRRGDRPSRNRPRSDARRGGGREERERRPARRRNGNR